MNETNNDQKQKPRTSKLAIASIICIVVFFGLICAMVVLPILIITWSVLVGLVSTIFSEYPVETEMADWPTWFEQVFTFFPFALLGTFLAAPILGIAALIHIRLSKGRLSGIGLAVSATAISGAIIISMLAASIFLAKIRTKIRDSKCYYGLRQLAVAIKLYVNDYEDQLPTSENWCDLLIIHSDVDPPTFSGHRELCDAMWGESAYALNKNVAGMKLSEIPGDVVLLFETTYGRTDSERDTPREARDYFWKINDPNYKWNILERKDLIYKDRWNQVGGPEILTTEYYDGKGCVVLFADGTVNFVKKEDLDTLRWEP